MGNDNQFMSKIGVLGAVQVISLITQYMYIKKLLSENILVSHIGRAYKVGF